jgi:CheY-like chemotaxis protein
VHKVFEPFAQGVSQPKTGKGLGLGLAIVKSLVEAFDGDVWAESAGRGRGCTFVVELPLLTMGDSTPPSSFGEEEEEQGPMRPRLDGMHILYVEDEAAVALAMRAGLQNLGADVDVAASQAEAARKLAGMPQLDAVVTDLNLGDGGSGHGVALALREQPRHAHVPVLAVSAFGTPEDVAATQEAGFAEHLIKPVSATAVARAIRHALGV